MQDTLSIHTTTRQIINNQLKINKQHDQLCLSDDCITTSDVSYPLTKIIDVSDRRMTQETFALYIHTDEGVKTFLTDYEPTDFTETLKKRI